MLTYLFLKDFSCLPVDNKQGISFLRMLSNVLQIVLYIGNLLFDLISDHATLS